MPATRAIAEDLRRMGLALIIASLVGALLEDKVSFVVAITTSIVGAAGCIVGYWVHGMEVAK